MATTEERERAAAGLDTSRLETLADGIFAIAMTLLVLDLHVPTIAQAVVSRELPHKLLAIWPNLFSYLLSFVVLGMYWVGHHNQFHFIRRSDRTLLWINIAFLMCISSIPFTAALLARYPREQITVVIYGGVLILVGLILYTNWWYATTDHRLVDADLPGAAIKRASRRILMAPAVYVVAIALSFLSPLLSLALYILVPVLYILPSGIDRHWSPRRGQHYEAPVFAGERRDGDAG